MKVGCDSQFHLTYCTNIHPGERWAQVFDNLQKYLPPLKAQLSPQQPFGIGLRLANFATSELLERTSLLREFQTWLREESMYVFTLNGFPYGNFHDRAIKDRVYAPDWSARDRVDYTLRAIAILAELLPPDLEGSISTVPLSYKPWWCGNGEMQTNPEAWESMLQACSLHLAECAAELLETQKKTGREIHLALEPEPDGAIENTTETIAFFCAWLLPAGGKYLQERLGISATAAEAVLRDRIRICYDTCHFAVEYEDPNLAFDRLWEAGIRIGKIQLSAALQVPIPATDAARRELGDRLRPFAESTYLHQVVARGSNGEQIHYQDLGDALPHLPESGDREWRTHFHVPIFIEDYQGLQSTQKDIATVLQRLQADPVCPHLEIETYTWGVLPADMKVDLLSSIRREYEWVLGAIAKEARNNSS